MLHYMVILHAFRLSTHNMVTYIYNLCKLLLFCVCERERESWWNGGSRTQVSDVAQMK